MARSFQEGRLVLASHNPGKRREIAERLAPLNIEVSSAADHDLPEPEETGTTFEDNARLKARAAAETTGLPALADDSGLCVHALNNAPGIYSARWAGPDKDFTAAMEKLHQKLEGAEDNTAHFACALALVWPDGHNETVTGRVFGSITWPPRGEKGFGYDPVFIPDGHTVTFGVLDPEIKQAISHRAQAFDKLMKTCFSGAEKK